MTTVVLVTGASGALGTAVVTHLNRHTDFRVIATSRLGQRCTEQLDVRDPTQLRKSLEANAPDIVLHLAATYADDFHDAYSINVESSRHLLNSVRSIKRPTRVVLIGSAAEYGFVHPDDNPVREDHRLFPVSIYGLTKAWQSQLAALYSSQGVDVVVARVFNLEGAGLSDRLLVGRVHKQISELLAGRRTAIEVGSLTGVRDYIGLEQAAEQLIAIATNAAAGDVYHIASGVPISMRDLLQRLLAKHGLGFSVVKEGPLFTNKSGHDIPIIFANMERTSKLLSIGSGRGNS